MAGLLQKSGIKKESESFELSNIISEDITVKNMKSRSLMTVDNTEELEEEPKKKHRQV
jgi:sorbitol-specific phosphotransferase system component IIBC